MLLPIRFDNRFAFIAIINQGGDNCRSDIVYLYLFKISYMQLISGIAKRAKMLTRVTSTESPSDNDKFTMRLFLVSLNFKGAEYAFARKFLLRNLSGNSSWRTEGAKARHDARKIQQEIEAPEAPEVTIEKSFEGGKNYAELS